MAAGCRAGWSWRSPSRHVKHRFVPGGAEQMIFRSIRTPENARLWDLLDDAQKKWSIEFCYCSVFDECWFVVKQCLRDEPNEFTP
jgi:hypothetical protein